jgi:tetratricopeptide (TPR) repeat protein
MGSNISSRSLCKLALIALIVRAFFLLQLSTSAFFARPILDQHYYDLCARQLCGAGGDIIDGFRPLLYPLFLTPFYAINANDGIFYSIVAQLVIGILMSIIIMLVSARLFDHPKAGMLAGLLFALSAPPLFFEGQLLIVTVFSFLLLCLWQTVLCALENHSTRRTATLWILAGIFLGLSAQARPNALPIVLFFPTLSLYRWLSSQSRMFSRISLPLLALPALLIVQLGFSAINTQFSGQFSLITQAGGINFYLGNAQKSDGMIPRQNRHVVYEDEYRDPIQVMAEAGYREHTHETGALAQKQVSKYWKDKTINEIKQDPLRWLNLMCKKSWLLLWNHEVPNNRSFRFAATQETTLLYWLPVRWWLLLFFAPWGIYRLLKFKNREQVLWILSFLVLYMGTIIFFFINSRFRIPLWPSMTILAGGGIAHLWKSIKSKSIPPIPMIISAIFLILSLINWYGVSADPIENDLAMRAVALHTQGRNDEALLDISQCLKLAPNNPRYHFTLGNIFLAEGNNASAIKAYLKAIQLNSEDPMFHNNLGIAFESNGDPQTAEVAYRQALSRQPRHTASAINLLLLLIRSGQLEAARTQLEPLLEEDAQNLTLQCAAAVIIYKETGSLHALEQAEKLNPMLVEQLITLP